MEVIFMEALKQDKKYTYEDYMSWPKDERWEIIDGVAYMLAAPTIQHQGISGELFKQLAVFLTGKPCRVYAAPFAVRLNNDDHTVVEPDISIVCDMSKLADGKICNGAPDMIIEILSPSTAGMDRLKKFNKYLQAGVREYWIVDPETKMVNVHMLKDGGYMTTAYGNADTVPVHVLDNCIISLPDVFAEM
jgi:Uma2 family endonuclease